MKVIRIRCPICGSRLDEDDKVFMLENEEDVELSGCTDCIPEEARKLYTSATISDLICNMPWLSLEDE